MTTQQKRDAALRIKVQMYKEIDLILKKTEQRLFELQQDENDRPEKRQ